MAHGVDRSSRDIQVSCLCACGGEEADGGGERFSGSVQRFDVAAFITHRASICSL